MIRPIGKKGAFEMSITTVVVIVISMTFLILGLLLVRNIFDGATGAVDLVNDNVRSQVNQLFNDQDTRTVIYLPSGVLKAKKDKTYNFEIGVRNVLSGTSGGTDFSYEIKSDDVTGCDGLTNSEADDFIVIGSRGTIPGLLPTDDPKTRPVSIKIPDEASRCSISYNVIVKEGAKAYDTNVFILEIEG